MYKLTRGFFGDDGLGGYVAPRVLTGGLAGGLGEEDCAQQVSTAERDRIRSELNDWTNHYMATRGGLHLHEGHPDIQAWLADLLPRMIGLTQRPKLLRCSAEARKKAREWTSTLNAMFGRDRRGGVFKRVVTYPNGSTGLNTVVPAGGYRIRTYNLRDYHARSFGKWAPEYWSSGGTVVTPKPAATPSVVVGVPFDPSKGGAGGDPTRTAPSPTVTTPGPGVPSEPSVPSEPTTGGPEPSPFVGAGAGGEIFGLDLGGSVGGVPTQYLVYGGLALLAWKMLGR